MFSLRRSHERPGYLERARGLSRVRLPAKMEPRLTQSRFSTHFNRLTYLGMWAPEMISDPRSRKLFWLYQGLCAIFLLVAILVQMTDLYFVVGNFRKVTYNFCTSVIVVGIAVKVILLYGRKKCLNELRLNLWLDSIKLKNPEDIAIHDWAYDQLKSIRKIFYLAAMVFLPVWIVSSYFSYKWGPRQLAFAGYIPMEDPLDDLVYVPALTYQAVCGFYVVFVVIEVDLAMFSLVLQMEAYYQILVRNILKLNEIYGEESDERSEPWKKGPTKEVNAYLKRESALRWLKLLIIRQLEILKYSQNFEYIFSSSMIVQIFAGSFLIVMNGLELSMFLQEMSVKLYFQSGYVVLIMVDILFICHHLSRLSTESMKVGTAAYSTVWYKMDADIQKSLCLIMIRSQRPPRITAGKLFLMDLNTYLHMLRNIYSWLMLFRQLGTK